MLSRLPLRYKHHLITAAIVTGTVASGYVFFWIGSMIKRWNNRQPTLLHEEMDDFLYWKELQEKKQRQRVVEVGWIQGIAVSFWVTEI
uniref:Uncharacterized protein n=2 Tax=Parascaris univalens TaxID=6257 RepID=A0A915BKV9_PARUN